jgi:sodium/bile acid cotransporter 7
MPHTCRARQAVGGNVAVALLLTVGSNLVGVFTMPLLLPRLLGDALPPGAGLEPLPLLARLVSCVLLPTLLAAGARAAVPGGRPGRDG